MDFNSRKTASFAVIGTFGLIFLIMYFKHYVIDVYFNPNHRNEHKLDKPVIRDDDSYTREYPVASSQNRVITFYDEELHRDMKEFINATERYDIFKTRIKYGLALECINRELKQTSLNWRGESSNFRKNARNNYAVTPERIQQSKDNEAFLFKNEEVFDFELIQDVEMTLLYPTDAQELSSCTQQIPTAVLFDQFINIYLNRYDTTNRSKEWYNSLKLQHSTTLKK